MSTSFLTRKASEMFRIWE